MAVRTEQFRVVGRWVGLWDVRVGREVGKARWHRTPVGLGLRTWKAILFLASVPGKPLLLTFCHALTPSQPLSGNL